MAGEIYVVGMFARIGSPYYPAETNLEVVGFQCTYGINEIPRATLLLPPGREVSTYLISNAHLLLAGDTLQIPINVYVIVLLPTGVTLMGNVFAGWITNVGYQVGNGQMLISVEVTHWLSALNFSSMLCETAHPRFPGDMSTLAGLTLHGLGANAMAGTLGKELFQADNITTDFWTESLKPWFTAAINSNRLQSSRSTGSNDSVNSDCIAALNLINYRLADYGMLPMWFAGEGESQATVADRMTVLAETIGNEVIYESLLPAEGMEMLLAQTTIWEKLLKLSATFHFAIVPLPTHALVVPYIAGLRSVMGTVYSTEIHTYRSSGERGRPLRAVGLMSAHGSGQDTFGLKYNGVDLNGWYVGRNDGVVQIFEAPRFITAVPASAYAHLTSGADNQLVANAFGFPTAGTAPSMPTPKEVQEMKLTPLDLVAHATYIREQLRKRTGRLTGPLRFDVAPGTSIAIEGVLGAFTAAATPTGGLQYASVQRVTIAIDAMAPSASTTFDLAHIRTAVENNDNAMSLARHPFYARVWTGEPLISLTETAVL